MADCAEQAHSATGTTLELAVGTGLNLPFTSA